MVFRVAVWAAARGSIRALDAFASLDATRVCELSLDWLHDETLTDSAGACLDSQNHAVNNGRNILQVGHEGALLARGRLDTDPAEVLGFTAVLADESGSGFCTSEMTNARHD